jgi:hypothetical protein
MRLPFEMVHGALEVVPLASRSGAHGGGGDTTHLSRVVEVAKMWNGRESALRSVVPPSSAKMLSPFFGQRFRSHRRLDPRPDQMVSP